MLCLPCISYAYRLHWITVLSLQQPSFCLSALTILDTIIAEEYNVGHVLGPFNRPLPLYFYSLGFGLLFPNTMVAGKLRVSSLLLVIYEYTDADIVIHLPSYCLVNDASHNRCTHEQDWSKTHSFHLPPWLESALVWNAVEWQIPCRHPSWHHSYSINPAQIIPCAICLTTS